MAQAVHSDSAVDAKGALAGADRRLVRIADVMARQVVLGPSRLLDDETCSRVRGLVRDLAAQLAGGDAAAFAMVRDTLAADRAIMTHLHALTIETQLIAMLAASRGLDPLLPPLVRRRLDAAIAGAMAAGVATAMLAAQSRVGQTLRRMRLPLDELPGDLQHLAHTIAEHAAASPVPRNRAHDGSQTRLALLRRVLDGLGDDLPLALRIDEAGVPLVLSALALASGHAREGVALACGEDDPVRLALLLRATGLPVAEAKAQLAAIRPDADPALAELVGDAATAETLLAGAA
jgi:hypothetical protein